jgi:hypothetical protein
LSVHPFDDSVPLDGIVGSDESLVDIESLARPDGVVQISIAGDAVSGPGAMGLAEDVELLVHAFVQRLDRGDLESASLDDKPVSKGKQKRAEPPSVVEEGGIGIALHGLQLPPDAHADLCRRIRELVEERMMTGEAGQ